MVKFIDDNRLPVFIAAFRPMLANSLEDQVEETYDAMVDNWEQGNDALGRPWEPLSPETIRQKGHSTPLIETRQMIESADYTVDEDELSAAIFIEDEPQKVLVHEHGAPDQGIPPRPILNPAKKHFRKESDGMLEKAFDRAYAAAAVGGTAMNVGFQRKSGMLGGLL